MHVINRVVSESAFCVHPITLLLSVSCLFSPGLIIAREFGHHTVCEDIVNNVVTAHLAQPHLKLPRVVRSWCGRIEKREKDISTITALTAPTIYSSPHQFFSIVNHVIHRNFCLALSSALRPTDPHLHLVLRVFLACLRVLCIRNAASPTGPVLPRSFPTPRSG